MIDIYRKIIFAHPPKTGGTTIEGGFGWHPTCDPNKIYKDFFPRTKHSTMEDHMTILKQLNENPNNYFKFVSIRNPWDLTVSYYFHHLYAGKINESHCSFDKFVYDMCKKNFLNLKKFIYYDNKLNVDYIVRYENYEKDVNFIFNKYNVTWPKMNYNAVSRPKNTPYKDFYTPKLRKIIEYFGQDYIDFGYKFDE
jgi:hypothetical protein